jgi:AbrB family looped-hinge helix DNA binding protein
MPNKVGVRSGQVLLRRMDQNARIQVPKKVRDMLELTEGTQLSLQISEKKIIIAKVGESSNIVGGVRSGPILLRRVDRNARIQLPLKFRDMLELTEDTQMSLQVVDGKIVLSKVGFLDIATGKEI